MLNNFIDNFVPIESVEFLWGNMPVDCHFSYGDVATFPFTLVKITSGEFEGWGEMLVHSNQRFFDFAADLVGKDTRLLDDMLGELLDIESEDKHLAELFSLAGYALLSNVSSLSIAHLLGGAKRQIIPLMPCIFPTGPEDGAAKAEKYARQGFKSLKMKLVAQSQRDLNTIKQIRGAIGKDIVFQGDANLGFSSQDIHGGILARLYDAGLDIIEDPFDGTVDEYLSQKKPGNPKIMIDVPARIDEQLKEYLEKGAVDFVNFHPCQQGTLKHAVDRYKMSESFGVPAVVGGTGFTGIGTVIYQQLASVIGLSAPCGELGGSFDHGMPAKSCEPLPIENGSIRLDPDKKVSIEPYIEKLQPYFIDTKQIVG